MKYSHLVCVCLVNSYSYVSFVEAAMSRTCTAASQSVPFRTLNVSVNLTELVKGWNKKYADKTSRPSFNPSSKGPIPIPMDANEKFTFQWIAVPLNCAVPDGTVLPRFAGIVAATYAP